MSNANNISLAHRWFDEVWNKGRSEVIDELFPDNAVMHGLAEHGVETRGPTNFKEFHKRIRGAFPDLKVTVEDALAVEDKVVVRFRVNATHKGDHLGVKATNKPIEFSGTSIGEVANGKFQECWNSWDQLGVLQQIGAVTPTQQVSLAGKVA
jgi:steroid delta-isomerase-like uncharacterized protein